jgi:hypothetical protein
LRGHTICVIGGAKERYYREVVEKYNGDLAFVSSDDLNKVHGAVRGAHVVFLLTDIVSHAIFYASIEAARTYHKPFKYVNSLGISRFKRELKSFATRGA